MQTTDKDYANKEWLRDERDAFQILDPDVAIFLLMCAGFAGYLLGSIP